MDSSSHKHSSSQDSDDWTLVSPPHSSSSASTSSLNSTGQGEVSLDEQSLDIETTAERPFCSSVGNVDSDGLMEIDLNEVSSKLKSNTCGVSSSNAELLTPEFQTISSGSEGDDEGGVSNDCSRRSSLTQSELGEYVDLGNRVEATGSTMIPRHMNCSGNTAAKKTILPIENESNPSTSAGVEGDSQQAERKCTLSIKARLDELSDAAEALHRDRNLRRLDRLYSGSTNEAPGGDQRSALWTKMHLVIFVLSLLPLIFNHFSTNTRTDHSQTNHHRSNPHKIRSSSDPLSLGGGIPSSRHYVELQLLNSELSQCIKRQSPSSFKYYLSEDRFKESSSSSSSSSSSNGESKSHKSYRGLVCYGHEKQWRKRLDNLKSDHDLDLRRLMQEAKMRVTNDLLESFHPALKFNLILNQLEYLDFMEKKRNKKQSEETIKHLKAENMQLLRRLNQPSESVHQKLVVSLEMKNSQLQREIEVLKTKLYSRAGSLYIEKSLEFEQAERENIILKQFHNQIWEEISKSLRQFNLHTVDPSIVFDLDEETLKSQLLLTRGYLRRLREKISQVLIENESLKEELKESFTTDLDNKANLPMAASMAQATNFYVRDENNSQALVVDSCRRSLAEMSERSSRLENEVDRLRRECGLKNELERNTDRHLNATRTRSSSKPIQSALINIKQPDSSCTAINKRAEDGLSVLTDNGGHDVVDDLMVLLTKFNDQIESNGLAIVNHNQQEQTTTAGYLSGQIKAPLDNEVKVLPNYLREILNRDEANRKLNGNQIAINQFSASGFGLGGASEASQPLVWSSSPPRPTGLTDWSQLGQEVQVTHQKSNLALNLTDAEMSPAIEPSSSGVSGSWFLKRATQRHLHRREKIEPADWLIKRAKLREKLRKASAYIEKNYIISSHKSQPYNHNFKNKRLSYKDKNLDGKYSCKSRKHHNKNHHVNDNIKRRVNKLQSATSPRYEL